MRPVTVTDHPPSVVRWTTWTAAAPARQVDDMDLGAIVRILVRTLFRAARVDVLPNPHPAESITTLDADAAVGRLLHQVAHAAHDLPLLIVDPHWLCEV